VTALSEILTANQEVGVEAVAASNDTPSGGTVDWQFRPGMYRALLAELKQGGLIDDEPQVDLFCNETGDNSLCQRWHHVNSGVAVSNFAF